MSKRLGMFFLVVAMAVAQSALGWGKQDNQKPSAEGTASEEMDKAVAVLNPTSSSGASGRVTFTNTDDGVRIVADLQGLTPGRHTLQISRAGDCSEIDRNSGTQGSMGTSGSRGTYGSPGTTTDETYGTGTGTSDDDRTSSGTYGSGTTTDRTGTGTTSGTGTSSGTGTTDDRSTSRTSGTFGSKTGTGVAGSTMSRILTADSNGKAYMEWTDSAMTLTGSNALVGAAVVVYAMDRTSGSTGTQGTPGMGSSGTTGSSGSGTSTGTGSTGSGTTGSGSTGGYGSEGSSSTGTYGSTGSGTTDDDSDTGRFGGSTGSGTSGTTGTTRRGTTSGSMGMGSGMLVACGMIESEED